MISADTVRHDIPLPAEHAHDLQLRLYREIGIAAVAAALNICAEPRTPVVEPILADIPSVLRGDDLAA